MVRIFATDRPLLFALGLTIACFVVLLFMSGVAYKKLRQPYGDVAVTMMRLEMTAGLLILVWRWVGWKGQASPGWAAGKSGCLP